MGTSKSKKTKTYHYAYSKSLEHNDAVAYKELEVYAVLTEYFIQAKDVDILSSLRILIPEFIKYAINRIIRRCCQKKCFLRE